MLETDLTLGLKIALRLIFFLTFATQNSCLWAGLCTTNSNRSTIKPVQAFPDKYKL